MIIERIIETFKDNINWYRINERMNNKVLSINFSEKPNFDKLLEIIKEEYNRYEIIISKIAHGEIFDSGLKSFEILDGYFIECYNFDKEETCFIRLYKIKDSKINKIFYNLYVDIVNESAWW